MSTPGVTSVTVHNVNGTSDNFFYQTGISSRTKVSEQSKMIYFDISDVSIIESDNKLNIKFKSDDNQSQILSFDLPDPDNRYVKTYIGARGSDFGITISRSGLTKWEIISGGLGFGWVTPVGSEHSLDASMWKSNEITWAMILGVKMSNGPHSLSAGLGLDWRNYVITGDHFFNKDNDGKISLIPYDDNMGKRRSRIKVFSLQIPLLYEFSFGHHRNFDFKVGPTLNFNTGGSIETQYTIGSHDYTIKTRHISQRPVTVDVMGAINYKSIGIYARYAPMNVLKKSTGLEFRSFSTGIMFFF